MNTKIAERVRCDPGMATRRKTQKMVLIKKKECQFSNFAKRSVFLEWVTSLKHVRINFADWMTRLGTGQ